MHRASPVYRLILLLIGVRKQNRPIAYWKLEIGIRIMTDNLFLTSGKIDLGSLSRLASPLSEI